MKPRVLLVISLLFLVSLLIFRSFRSAHPSRNVNNATGAATEAAAQPTSQIGGEKEVSREPQKTVAARSVQERLEELVRSRGVSLNVLTQQLTQEASTQFAGLRQQALEQMGADFRWPITFYGQVLDERTNPVAEANVQFTWLVPYPNEPAKRDAKSDANGLFELTGATGRTLTVHVSKPGYYTINANQLNFEYSQKNNAVPHNPDPNNPVIFHLRKKGPGTDLITSQYGVFSQLEFSGPRDGTTTRVDFFNRKVGNEGQLELSAIKPPRNPEDRSAKEWSFRLSVPDGGFVENFDEFPFEAPESGYQPTLEFHFNPGETNWTDTLGKQYYIVFGQPPKYGRITVETGIYGGVRLGYAINPDGTRDLEPKEVQPPRRQLPPGVIEVIPGGPK
jgi:hypothetical protein